MFMQSCTYRHYYYEHEPMYEEHTQDSFTSVAEFSNKYFSKRIISNFKASYL